MPLPNSSLIRDPGNRLVNEELDYDRDQLNKLHEILFAALNACQKSAYEAIMHSVENEEGCLFFINGHGGIVALLLPNALDRILRDILITRYENSSIKPFGGLTIVCGGDF
ncbi:hypothetical protein AB3S75_044869 [Citrus x aurantiifolia]